MSQVFVPSRKFASYVNLLGGYATILLNMISGLLLVPLYLHYIDNRIFGGWTGSGDIIGWLGLFDLGLASLMIQRMSVAYGKHNTRLVGEYLSTGLALLIMLAVLIVVLAFAIADHFPGWMGFSGEDASLLSSAFLISTVATSFGIINNGVVGFSVSLQRTVFVNINSILGGVLRILFTVVLLANGVGLLSIPLGLLFYQAMQLTLNSISLIKLYRKEIIGVSWPQRDIIREFLSMSPAMMAAKLGNAVMSRSSAALIAVFLTPDLSTVFVLTARTCDIIRMFLDRIGGSAFSAFAHLAGSGQPRRSLEVYKEIIGIHAALSVLMVGLYFAFNRSFVGLWVGNQFFGGYFLTLSIGISLLASGRSTLLEYFYGATGKIVQSSYIILFEALVQIPLMFIMLPLFKLPGLPLANALTSIFSSILVYRLTLRQIGDCGDSGDVSGHIKWGAYFLLLLSSSLFGKYFQADDWSSMLAIGIIASLIFTSIVLLFEVSLRNRLARVYRQIHQSVMSFQKRTSAERS